MRSDQKMKAAAEAGAPEAIERYEAHLAKHREDYHKKAQQVGDFSIKIEPRIHDNRNGLDYILTDNYYLQALRLPEDKRPIGR